MKNFHREISKKLSALADQGGSAKWVGTRVEFSDSKLSLVFSYDTSSGNCIVQNHTAGECIEFNTNNLASGAKENAYVFLCNDYNDRRKGHSWLTVLLDDKGFTFNINPSASNIQTKNNRNLRYLYIDNMVISSELNEAHTGVNDAVGFKISKDQAYALAMSYLADALMIDKVRDKKFSLIRVGGQNCVGYCLDSLKNVGIDVWKDFGINRITDLSPQRVGRKIQSQLISEPQNTSSVLITNQTSHSHSINYEFSTVQINGSDKEVISVNSNSNNFAMVGNSGVNQAGVNTTENKTHQMSPRILFGKLRSQGLSFGQVLGSHDKIEIKTDNKILSYQDRKDRPELRSLDAGNVSESRFTR